MKNLTKSIIAAALLIVSTSSFASTAYNSSPAASNPLKYVKATTMVDVYLDAVTNGDVELVQYLFDENFTQTYHVAKNKNTYHKNEVMKFIQNNKGYAFNCASSYQILEAQDNYSIIKASLTFQDFTRVDMLTLQKTADGWKITKVDVTYP